MPIRWNGTPHRCPEGSSSGLAWRQDDVEHRGIEGEAPAEVLVHDVHDHGDAVAVAPETPEQAFAQEAATEDEKPTEEESKESEGP